jgi:hypothetical protein
VPEKFGESSVVALPVICEVRANGQSSAKLFDAYNQCDLTTLGAMVSDDLEFYHDQAGLSVGRAPFLAAIKENICGKHNGHCCPLRSKFMR